VSSTLPSNDSANQQQILNDIQSLQNIEKDSFDSLETTPNLTSEQNKQIIKKINSISQMRVNLYQTLGNVNTFYKNTIVNSQEILHEQKFAIGIVEKQLNEAKKKLEDLELKKNNKIRLVEINNYYGERYDEYAVFMKYIVYMLIPIIIISFIYNLGLLPRLIFYALLIIIIVIGSIFIIYQLISILSRDNMNYQKYLWNFNIKNAPSIIKGNNGDPWLSNGIGIGTCIGSNCCSNDMTYDIDIDQCVPNPSSCSTKQKR
jgi:hypothetical protein